MARDPIAVVRDFARSGDVTYRARACNALALLEGDSALASLVTMALEDGEASVRARARERLSTLPPARLARQRSRIERALRRPENQADAARLLAVLGREGDSSGWIARLRRAFLVGRLSSAATLPSVSTVARDGLRGGVMATMGLWALIQWVFGEPDVAEVVFSFAAVGIFALFMAPLIRRIGLLRLRIDRLAGGTIDVASFTLLALIPSLGFLMFMAMTIDTTVGMASFESISSETGTRQGDIIVLHWLLIAGCAGAVRLGFLLAGSLPLRAKARRRAQVVAGGCVGGLAVTVACAMAEESFAPGWGATWLILVAGSFATATELSGVDHTSGKEATLSRWAASLTVLAGVALFVAMVVMVATRGRSTSSRDWVDDVDTFAPRTTMNWTISSVPDPKRFTIRRDEQVRVVAFAPDVSPSDVNVVIVREGHGAENVQSSPGRVEAWLPQRDPRRTFDPSGLLEPAGGRKRLDARYCVMVVPASTRDASMQSCSPVVRVSRTLDVLRARLEGRPTELFGTSSMSPTRLVVLFDNPERRRAPSSIETSEIRIPEGCSWIGCNASTDTSCTPRTEPGRVVCQPSYMIDRTEVSVADYAKCVRDEGCSTTGFERPSWNGRQADARMAKECNWTRYRREPEKFGRYPMNCVTAHQAADFCARHGKRLPSAVEWERAGRGDDGRRFPWGDDAPGLQRAVGNLADATLAETFPRFPAFEEYEDGYVGTAPVGTFADGASPFGVLDMAGNVVEWIGPPGDPAEMRGGSWATDPSLARLSAHVLGPADQQEPDVGFRCARDVPESSPVEQGAAP